MQFLYVLWNLQILNIVIQTPFNTVRTYYMICPINHSHITQGGSESKLLYSINKNNVLSKSALLTHALPVSRESPISRNINLQPFK